VVRGLVRAIFHAAFSAAALARFRGFLLKHHRSHHRATRNYGVSTTLWDPVFGTVLRWALDLLIVVILQ
jgi:sterol desaturase/sphingolipid hydroxylase (fatty acid hydroxylase superfamily)